MITKAQYNAWLADPDAERIALVEAGAYIDGVESTLYLSTGNYVTKANEIPPSQVYLSIIPKDALTISEALSLDYAPTMATGEVAIRNASGEVDAYQDYIWSSRRLRVYWGHPSWARADFRLRFNGVTDDIAPKGRDFSLKLRDKMQRLDAAVSEAKLGGDTTNKDAVIPVGVGELENITPLLTDAATLEYQYDIGPSEGVGEVRDNGIPLIDGFTHTPTTGKFKLLQAPAGAVTCSAQGQKPGGVYIKTIAAAVRHLAANFGTPTDRFNVTSSLVPGRYDFTVEQLATFSRASTATFITSAGLISSVLADAARYDYSSDAAVLIEAAATNYIADSSTFSVTYWTGCTVTTNAAAYRGVAYKSVAKTLVSAGEGCVSSVGAVAAGAVRTATIALRAGTDTSVAVGLYDSGGTAWGAGSAATAEALEGPGVVSQSSGGLFLVTGLSASVDTLVRITRTYAASGTGAFHIYPGMTTSTTVGRSILATRVQVEAGAVVTSYIPTSSGAVTREADVATAWEDLDIASLTAFDVAHQQQIGLYMADRINVINACQQLASSVGAQVNLSRRGWLRLLQIDFTDAVSTFDIYPEHMVEATLNPVQRPPVVGAIKLGFNQEWTEQAGLVTGLSAADKELFATKWLSTTVFDSAVCALYKLSTDPVQQDTLLLRLADAGPEALRRLNLKKVQRTVYQFDGRAEMGQLDLAQIVTVHHPRFGLSAGKLGMVVSLKSTGAGSRITVGVLI